ncbi:SUHW-like protein [Mya arenaria]|uniref:SUHW-like protein n=1 Tax=Mya arenaria TaxID=6604 RepID=A0ABY7FYR6_MYAAR|nr:SUHW-like protein [Mya arenaria]
MEKKQSDTLSDDSDEELNRRESQNFKKKDKGFKCVICSKHYKTIRARRQHMQSHMIKRKCEQCDKSYARLEKLRNHQKKVHGLHRPQRQTSASFSCTLCNKTFGREYNLNRHKAKVHQRTPRRCTTQFSCRHCEREFQNYDELFHHVSQNHPLNQQGGRRATTPAALNVDEPYDQQSVKQLVDGSDASIEKEDNGERNNDDEKENDNEDNDDDKCFLYCLIASLHPTAIEPERVEHYYQYEYEVNMSGISFPVTLSQIRKVERQNEHISINVFAYEDESIVPLRITEQRHRLHHVNLLWLMHEEKSHYWVKTLTMENVRLHKNIELVHTEGRLQKVTAKPAYKNTTIFNEDLVAVELYRTKVSLCKPIFCGMSVLDLSKCLMYDFWYNYIKTKYNNASTQLQMTDTGTYGGGARSTKVQLKRVRSDGKTVAIHSDLLNGAVLKIKRYLGMTENDSGIHPDLSRENVNVFNDQLIGYRICRTQTKLYWTPIKLDFQVNLVQQESIHIEQIVEYTSLHI